MFNLKPEDYKKYRWFFSSRGNLVVGGKNDKQNEFVINNFLKPDYTLVHTSEPGSPFMIIQNAEPSKEEIDEAAVFCVCFSKQWKNLKPQKSSIFGSRKSTDFHGNKKDKISVDIFKGEQIYKTNSMKIGTFGVKGEKKTIKVKPELILIFQNDILKTVPKNMKNENEVLAEIVPGNLSKEEAAEKLIKKIKNKFVSKDEIMSIIPSDKLEIK